MVTRLHMVGCGRAGRVLARLWLGHEVFRIGWIMNRSPASAAEAAQWIGSGRAVASPDPIEHDDALMLAAPDGVLAELAAALAGQLDRPPALAFHLSGAEYSSVLRPLGCPVAAIHPVCPFADPDQALDGFAHSFAMGEGDPEALRVLLPAFRAIGAQAQAFTPVDKRMYHAATIAASNFLNALDALALALAERGGLARAQALPMIASLQRIALANIERDGPARALTGPIERADQAAVESLAQAVSNLADGADQRLFAALGQATVRLAGQKRGQDPAWPALASAFARLASEARRQVASEDEPDRADVDGGV